MPEGHTIHRAALDQRKMLLGHVLRVASPQGRFAEGAAEFDGVVQNAIVTVDGVKKNNSRYGERVNIFNKGHYPRCHSEITRIEMATRRAFYCETCQPSG